MSEGFAAPQYSAQRRRGTRSRTTDTRPGNAGHTTGRNVPMLAFIVTLQNLLADRKDDRGATAVEYGLIVVLIAAVIVGVVATIGQDVLGGFQTVETTLP